MGSKRLLLSLALLEFAFLNGFFLHSMAQSSDSARYYEFQVFQKPYERLCSERYIFTVNGSFPGPELRAERGDTIIVNVFNFANVGITIHWHGVRQIGEPWYDGPAYITQCPIRPGSNFSYVLSLSEEEGTLWWHAHMRWLRTTVHGAIHIYPDKNKEFTYPFSKPRAENTIIFASWYNETTSDKIEDELENGADTEPPDALLINGQPGYLYPCSSDNAYRMLLYTGKTTLLRLVNAAMNEALFFGVTNHSFTVVGMDGAYLEPFCSDFIFITPGQTMDVLIEANQPPGYYLMAAYAFASAINTTTTGRIRYIDFKQDPPNDLPLPELPDQDDAQAVADFISQLKSKSTPQQAFTIPKQVDKSFYITTSVSVAPCPQGKNCSGPGGTKFIAALNNISFVLPTNTSILQAYKRTKGVYETDFPSKPPTPYNYTGGQANINTTPRQATKVMQVNYNDRVEIVFQGTLNKSGVHPLHLHGFNFFVVRRGTGNFNPKKDPPKYNLLDAASLNTAPVPFDGWIAIRFVADNPGVWFVHCHLEKHTTWGMTLVLIVLDGDEDRGRMHPPPAIMPSCPKTSTPNRHIHG